MGVGEPAFTLIGSDQLTQRYRVDSVAVAGQISRLIVTPQLTIGQVGNGADEGAPIGAARAIGHGGPVERERTGRGIARVTHRAINGTCNAGGGADGYRTRLGVCGLVAEMDSV